MSRDRHESARSAQQNIKQLETFLALVKGGALAIQTDALQLFLSSHGLDSSLFGSPPAAGSIPINTSSSQAYLPPRRIPPMLSSAPRSFSSPPKPPQQKITYPPVPPSWKVSDAFTFIHSETGNIWLCQHPSCSAPQPLRNRRYGSYAATTPESTANIKKRAWEHTYKHGLEEDPGGTISGLELSSFELEQSRSRQSSYNSTGSDIAVFDSRPSSVYSTDSSSAGSCSQMYTSPYTSPLAFSFDDFDTPMSGYEYPLPTW